MLTSTEAAAPRRTLTTSGVDAGRIAYTRALPERKELSSRWIFTRISINRVNDAVDGRNDNGAGDLAFVLIDACLSGIDRSPGSFRILLLRAGTSFVSVQVVVHDRRGQRCPRRLHGLKVGRDHDALLVARLHGEAAIGSQLL